MLCALVVRVVAVVSASIFLMLAGCADGQLGPADLPPPMLPGDGGVDPPDAPPEPPPEPAELSPFIAGEPIEIETAGALDAPARGIVAQTGATDGTGDPTTTEPVCTRGTARDAPVRQIIRETFGRHGDAALRVAWCESGPWGTTAQNGQYKGLFQMGRYERATYGHGPCAEVQAAAAHRYFVASGRDWSPWACRP